MRRFESDRDLHFLFQFKSFMDIILIIGIFGSIVTLVAFILNQINKWSSERRSYDAANFIGAALLLIYAISTKSYPFILTNSIWALLSLKDLLIKKRE